MRDHYLFVLICLYVGLGSAMRASQLPDWPTPNPAFREGRALRSYIQPSSSGLIESGLFGCVRNGGARFHEGIDLFPIKRDARGEALDPIYAILPGRVVHVSAVAGHSSYGRYVVIAHQQASLRFYSLYAHLASIEATIKPGRVLEAGATLGVMGRSAGGYRIPKSQAHLHFELALKMSDQFQTWYDRQKFGSQNYHGMWNGMNLLGVDPLEFYQKFYIGKSADFNSYVQQIKVAARIRVMTQQVPDFVRNHPSLVTTPYQGLTLSAWDIGFSKHGVPVAWTPRFKGEGLAGGEGDVSVIAYSSQSVQAQKCRHVVQVKGKQVRVSAASLRTLQILFGFK